MATNKTIDKQTARDTFRTMSTLECYWTKLSCKDADCRRCNIPVTQTIGAMIYANQNVACACDSPLLEVNEINKTMIQTEA